MRRVYQGLIFLNKYKAHIVFAMFVITLFGGLFIYLFDYNLGFTRALSNTVNLYIDALPDKIGDKEPTTLLEVVSIFAKLTLYLPIAIWFFKSQLASTYHRFIAKDDSEHVLVIGLDSNSRFFIDNELKNGNQNIIVVENDEFNPYIDVYRDKAISVIHKEIDGVIDEIGIDSVKYIFVSTGDSEENISTALKIVEKAKDSSNKKLLVHIENRTLRSLYNDQSLLDRSKFDIQPFSFHKEASRILFQKHDIDGDGFDIIESDKPFEIAIIGDSNLSIEVIVEAIKIFHLPNENQLTINCIDPNIKSFRQRVEYEIPYIQEVKHLHVNYIELDYESREFYYHNLWHKENLKHIIISHPKSIVNINISTKLKRLAYNGELDNSICKIHVATYDHVEISNEIRKYSRKNEDIFVFAEANIICDSKNLIDTEIEKLGKMIHYSYDYNLCDPSFIVHVQKVIDRVWEGKTKINDKRSSIAQAKHIKVKLKALRLYKVKSDKKIDELVKINRAIFDKVLDSDRKKLNLTDEKLYHFAELSKKSDTKSEIHYFPKEYDTLFEKLLRAEHNRWIAMLVMMDNHYDPKAKDMEDDRKIKKVHHLMKPFEEFSDDEKHIVFYDIYPILYIPEYLASLGYELKESEK